jgi:hypothetical protein
MLEYETIQLIKSRNKGWNKYACIRFVDKCLTRIKAKLPDGIPSNQYFVLPGFEDVCHNQPIIIFDPTESMYKLTLNNKFNK